MIILGLDPGKTTGWGLIGVDDRRISIKDFGEFKWTKRDVDSLQGWIKSVDLVVYEAWYTDREKAMAGDFNQDVMWAPEAIGLIKGFCLLSGHEPIVSNRSVKPVGYGYLGMKYQKGKKGMHSQDALCHAVYHAVRKLGALPLGNEQQTSSSIPFSRGVNNRPTPQPQSRPVQTPEHIPSIQFGKDNRSDKS